MVPASDYDRLVGNPEISTDKEVREGYPPVASVLPVFYEKVIKVGNTDISTHFHETSGLPINKNASPNARFEQLSLDHVD